MANKSTGAIIAGLFLALFTSITLFMTISIFFDLFGIREKEGNYVLFVVIANFIAGLIYIPAVYGFFTKKEWTSRLLFIATILLVVTFIGLTIYIMMDGIYERKTIFAMIFRTAVTFGFAILALRLINRSKKVSN
ncbi:MAG: hypothetical protein KF829_03630 [Ferruginibacter sp.]|nr:hypothetical protein [Ferruginibacter sp.]